jgi:deoxypyrimidine-specific 5' nucleotidase type C protein (NT5C)
MLRPHRLLHLAIDLDDVVLDFMPSVMESFYREYGIRPEFDGQPWGEMATKFYKHPLFLESGYKSWWDWLRDREWLWATFPAVPGAIGGIKRLRADGHYVECVTSKPEWAEHNVWKWLGKWRPSFQQVTIVTTGEAKIDMTDADVIVDDKQETVQDFRNNGRYGILFDRSRIMPNSVSTIASWKVAHVWEQVVRCVREIANEK